MRLAPVSTFRPGWPAWDEEGVSAVGHYLVRVDVWVEAATDEDALNQVRRIARGLRVEDTSVLYEQGAIRQAAKQLHDAGVADDALDDDVIDVATNLASDVNNEGFESQLRFLAEQWGMKYALQVAGEVLHDTSCEDDVDEDDPLDDGN